jgi:uncharacterized protein (TIGR02996 family)
VPANSPPHPEELAFHQAIIENPEDEATYLVLADWLEDHGAPQRAELLRLHRRLLATCWKPEQYPERADWQARVVELLAQGVRPSVPQRVVDLGRGIEMTFRFIPPGRFLMGSPRGEEGRDTNERQHHVTLTRGFFLGVHQVTQRQWQAVFGDTPSHCKGEKLPVDSVNWEECLEFCRALAWDGQPFRLPTEAEWEYACRAGTTTQYCSGNGLEALRQVGWCSYDGHPKSAKTTKPVGEFQPNAFGLFDMHGNVWEWCLDGQRRYTSRGVVDPKGPEGEDVYHVLRGGSWGGYPRMCRAAKRNTGPPEHRNYNWGCRVALCLD